MDHVPLFPARHQYLLKMVVLPGHVQAVAAGLGFRVVQGASATTGELVVLNLQYAQLDNVEFF